MKSLTSAISRAAVRTCSAVFVDCASAPSTKTRIANASGSATWARGITAAPRTHDASRAMARICGRKWPARGSVQSQTTRKPATWPSASASATAQARRADHDAERGTDLERLGAVVDLHVAAGSDRAPGAA